MLSSKVKGCKLSDIEACNKTTTCKLLKTSIGIYLEFVQQNITRHRRTWIYQLTQNIDLCRRRMVLDETTTVKSIISCLNLGWTQKNDSRLCFIYAYDGFLINHLWRIICQENRKWYKNVLFYDHILDQVNKMIDNTRIGTDPCTMKFEELCQWYKILSFMRSNAYINSSIKSKLDCIKAEMICILVYGSSVYSKLIKEKQFAAACKSWQTFLTVNCNQDEIYELFKWTHINNDALKSNSKYSSEFFTWLISSAKFSDLLNEMSETKWIQTVVSWNINLDWLLDMITKHQNQISNADMQSIALIIADGVTTAKYNNNDIVTTKCIEFVNDVLNLRWQLC